MSLISNKELVKNISKKKCSLSSLINNSILGCYLRLTAALLQDDRFSQQHNLWLGVAGMLASLSV